MTRTRTNEADDGAAADDAARTPNCTAGPQEGGATRSAQPGGQPEHAGTST